MEFFIHVTFQCTECKHIARLSFEDNLLRYAKYTYRVNHCEWCECTDMYVVIEPRLENGSKKTLCQ